MTSVTKAKAGRFGRYVVVGLATNATIYGIFLILIWVGVFPILASAVCYLFGVIASYVLNRTWTFASTSNHSRDIVRFSLAYGFGLGVTMLSMYFLIDPLGPKLAQLLTIGITAISIYSMLELLRFGR